MERPAISGVKCRLIKLEVRVGITSILVLAFNWKYNFYFLFIDMPDNGLTLAISHFSIPSVALSSRLDFPTHALRENDMHLVPHMFSI